MRGEISQEDIDWAEAELARLEKLWAPGSVAAFDDNRGSLVEAVEFLRLKAGARSEFYLSASDAAKRRHAHTACRIVAHALLGWINFAERGLIEVPVDAQFRQAAATDLMEQVETLLQDRKVLAAAPVMLAGAALEELLRSMVDIVGLKPKGKAGIISYSLALRDADVLTVQEVKDITSWAGMRNSAAHGQFNGIELPNARLMAQGVNLFMQKHATVN